MNVRRLFRLLVVLLMVIWIYITIDVVKLYVQTKRDNVILVQNNEFNVITKVLLLLKHNYVEELSDDELIESAVEGIVGKLDRHTKFFKPKEFDDFSNTTHGEFGGLGITIKKIENYITVLRTQADTPAMLAGLQPGDRIVKADTTSLIGFTEEQCKRVLEGRPGSKVLLFVERPGEKEVISKEITRDIITISAVPAAMMLSAHIGYIKLDHFSDHTDQEFADAMDYLNAEGMKKLILDLRGNPGGLLDQAVNIADFFLPSQKLVVSSKGKSLDSMEEYYTKIDIPNNDLPILVLIDRQTASASEVVAGALQDWDRAIIAGENSWGKGTIQTFQRVGDKYGIKFTIAKYYTSSGRCIHKENAEKNEKEKMFTTAKGRIVHGAGGIEPDVFLRDNALNSFQYDLWFYEIPFQFAVMYFTKHNLENVSITNQIYEQFIAFTSKKDILIPNSISKEMKQWILNYIEAEFHNIIFNEKKRLEVLLSYDKQIQEAVEILRPLNTQQEMFDYLIKEAK